MSLDRTPMRVKIIAGQNAQELEDKVNEFLETPNLDTYNVIDNVVGDDLSFTILHRIKPDMPEAELKEVVEAKLEKHNAKAE
jgi:acetylornithine deacetylase/succinyl-diaminopimelate desuccinylase-like protein